jgi:hypothetical protein
MAQNPNLSHLDQGQILNRVFDPLEDRLRTDAQSSVTIVGDIECDIDASTGDNIALASADGSKKVDVETVGGKNGLDVNVLNQIASTPIGLSTAIRTQRVTVTDVATELPPIALTNRNTISVRVIGTATVYFGDNSVSASDGYPKFQFEEIFMDVRDNNSVALYGICDPGQSCEVAIIEIA